jgi:phosphopantothenoylcysteine decarboxylase / phosphopantothenate---cysteine ligase
MLKNKKITLLISGGIAAYKMVGTVSALTQLGADVTCVLTNAAETLVPALALKTLSMNRVYTDKDYFDAAGEYEKVIHIRLAQQTDLIVLAPATGNTIAKFRHGIADNLVTSVLLAANNPVVVFPAMNDIMYGKTATAENIDGLKKWGIDVIEPDSGYLACGTNGPGRLPETGAIIEYIKYKLYDKKDLAGRKVLVNAGGTSEKIDAARCLTNLSSGKMGISLAKEAFYRGAEVTLVAAGKDDLALPFIKVINVTTSDEMFRAMRTDFGTYDIVLFAAAVSDFIPEKAVSGKIKKSDTLTLRLINNIDIAAEFSKIKTDKQIFIGFCAETEDLENRAKDKMEKKKFDHIFANDISSHGIGFGSDNNSGLLIGRNGKVINIPVKSKDEIASDIFNEVCGIQK